MTEIDRNAAIRNFKTIYPEFYPQIIGYTDDKSGFVVFVGDGYHAINERIISRFFENEADARRETL